MGFTSEKKHKGSAAVEYQKVNREHPRGVGGGEKAVEALTTLCPKFIQNQCFRNGCIHKSYPFQRKEAADIVRTIGLVIQAKLY